MEIWIGNTSALTPAVSSIITAVVQLDEGSGTDELSGNSQQQFTKHLCGAGGTPVNFDEALIV